MLEKNSVSLNAVIDLTLGFLFKIFGFFGIVYLSRKFGATSETDQIYYVLTIILAITGIFQVVNSAIIFPILSNSIGKKNKEGSLNLCLNFSFYTLIFISIFSLIFIFFSDSLVFYFSKFVKPIQMPFFIKIAYVLIVFFVFLFDSLMNIARALGNFYHHNIAQILGALFSLISIIYLSNPFGPYTIIYSYLLSYTIQTLVLSFIFYKHQIFDEFNFVNLFSQRYLHLIKLIPPYFYQQLLSFLVSVLPNYLISSDVDGNLSSVFYAKRLFELALSFLVLPIIGALSPLLSESYSGKNIYSSLSFMNYLLIPISIYIIFFGDFFVAILFKKSITDVQLDLFLNSLKIFFLSLSSLAFVSLITRTLVMNQSHKFAYVNLYQSVISTMVLLTSMHFSVKYFGSYGLSIGHTIFFVIFGQIICFSIWRFYFGHVGFIRNLLSNIFPIIFSLFAGFFTYSIINYLFDIQVIRFFMSILIFFIIYLLFCCLFKTEFFTFITSKLKLLLAFQL